MFVTLVLLVDALVAVAAGHEAVSFRSSLLAAVSLVRSHHQRLKEDVNLSSMLVERLFFKCFRKWDQLESLSNFALNCLQLEVQLVVPAT